MLHSAFGRGKLYCKCSADNRGVRVAYNGVIPLSFRLFYVVYCLGCDTYPHGADHTC